MSKSSLALGNLRGFAIAMVVAFHSCIAYLAWGPAAPLPFDSPPFDWTGTPIVDSARWGGFDVFCAFQFIYLMQLMFILSGLFVWPSLLRKGAAAFVTGRFLRLAVPFLVGAFLLMPVAYYPVYRVTATDPSWSAFWSHWIALPFWPSGPMWFLSLLLAFDIAAAALYRLAPRAGKVWARWSAAAGAHPGRFFVAFVAVSALAYVPLAAVFKPWDWSYLGPFAIQPSLAPQYAIYFFAGVAMGTNGIERGLLAADGALARHWGRWLASVPVGFLLWIIPTALIVNAAGAAPPLLQVAADLGMVLCVATACFGLTAAFLRFAARPRPLLASVSEHAYGIYLVHYFFVVWLQYLLLDVPWPAIVKAPIVFAVTLFLSWAVSVAVCRIPFGARLIGGRRPILAPVPATRRRQ